MHDIAPPQPANGDFHAPPEPEEDGDYDGSETMDLDEEQRTHRGNTETNLSGEQMVSQTDTLISRRRRGGRGNNEDLDDIEMANL